MANICWYVNDVKPSMLFEEFQTTNSNGYVGVYDDVERFVVYN